MINLFNIILFSIVIYNYYDYFNIINFAKSCFIENNIIINKTNNETINIINKSKVCLKELFNKNDKKLYIKPNLFIIME